MYIYEILNKWKIKTITEENNDSQNFIPVHSKNIIQSAD